MKKTEPVSNHALMKKINRAKVLNAIRLHSPLSRSDIAVIAALDKKSITNFVLELSHEDLVAEIGKKKTEQGRPFTMLSFHRDRHLVLGLSIEPERVIGVLLNLYGETVAVEEAEFPADSELKRILAAIGSVYNVLRKQSELPLKGVGVAIPGVTDIQAGTVLDSINLPALRNVNLRKRLAALIEEPLFLEEASQAKALAEKWFGLGRKAPELTCIDLGIGVGAGILHEGRLYRGAPGYAGEIGHILIEANGRACRCGNRGCLEAYLSERSLLQEIQAASGRRYRRLRDIDPLATGAREVLGAAGYRLGLGLSYLINLICPSTIVLNGDLMKFQDAVMPELWRGVRQHGLQAYVACTKILISDLQHAAALGAASLVLSDVFEVQGHYYV